MKLPRYKIGLALCVVGGIVACLLPGRKAPPAGDYNPALTVTASNPSAAPGARPIPVPAESLPIAGVDFTRDSSDEELLSLARRIVARSPERALAWAKAQEVGS